MSQVEGSEFQSVESNDEYEDCILCGNLTEPNPHSLHIREEGGANHGDYRAKAYVCLNCLKNSEGWAYNQVKE